MKSKITKLSLCFILAFMFLTGSDMYSQGRNRIIGRGMNNSNYTTRNSLNLTDKQIEKIQNIRDECYTEQAQDQKLFYEKMTKLNTLMLSDNRDKEAVNNLINEVNDEINVIQDRIIKRSNNSQTKIVSILTKEQKALVNTGIGRGLGLGINIGTGRGLGFGMGNGWRRSNSLGRGLGSGRGNGLGRSNGMVPGQGRMQINQRGFRGNGRGYYCPWNNLNTSVRVGIGRGRNVNLNDGRLHRNRWW